MEGKIVVKLFVPEGLDLHRHVSESLRWVMTNSSPPVKGIVQLKTHGSVKNFTYSITFVRINCPYLQSENYWD